MLKPRFEVMEVNPGFCRVLYKTKNPAGERIYYLIQDNGKHGMEFYRATLPPWFEPEYACKPKDWSLIDEPTGDSPLEIKTREFLKTQRG